MNLRTWIGGLIAAASGGASGALGPAVIDPDHFGVANVKHILVVAGICAVVPVLAYLARSPLPGVNVGRADPPQAFAKTAGE